MGTVNLLEALRQLKEPCAVVNVTSDKCYENREWVWGYREDEPMGGRDPYSNSKGCAELVTAGERRRGAVCTTAATARDHPIGVTIPFVILAVVLWAQARSQNRSPSYVGDRDLVVPPALVMRRGESLERFATDLSDLRGKADANRAFVEREDLSPEEDESD